MTERHPPQSDDHGPGRPGDPFAELALIIGFDPRQKIRSPAAAALGAAAATDERPVSVEAAGAGEPEGTGAVPEQAQAPGESQEHADAASDAPQGWDGFAPLELDFEEPNQAGDAQPALSVEPQADDAWADDAQGPLLDDESWQQAVAASLDRITGEINDQAASREASRVEPAASSGADDPLPALPLETQRAPAAERLEPSVPEAQDPLDEELSIEAADWDLLGLVTASEDEPPPRPRAQESPEEPSAPELRVDPAESAEVSFEELDFADEIDLDHVLAESIERELEEAWSNDIAAAVEAPEDAVHARVESSEAQPLEPEAPADRGQPNIDDLDFGDFHLDEPEPTAAPEPTSWEEQPVLAQPEPEEVTADVPEPEFEALDLDEPQFSSAPEPVEASESGDPAPQLQMERRSEADFEAELAALLAQDDEPSLGVSEAPIAVEGPQALHLPSPVEATVPESLPGPAQARESAASAGPAGNGLEPPAQPEPRPEPVQAAPEPVRPASRQPGPQPAEDDPFAALAAMAARYRSGGAARPLFPTQATERKAPEPAPRMPEAVPPPVEQRVESEDPVETMRSQPPSRHETPEIETVDVPEPAAALVDDLDIPELPVERPQAARAPFDDLDTEFAELLQEMTEGRRATQPAPSFRATWETKSPRAPAAQDFSHGAPRHEPHGYAAPNAEELFERDEHAAAAQWRHADEERDTADARAAGAIEGFEQDDEPALRDRGRRGFWLASLLAGVVLAGGVGAYAVGSGGIAISGAPALIKADAEPIKVKPKDPGGVKVPNQDNKVYQRVAGGPLDTPTQAKLVASAEEPVSLVEPVQPTPPADDLSLDLGGDSVEALVKIDERFSAPAEAEAEPAPIEEEAVTVVPRKVRTMTVRADGTLVPNDEAAPAEAPQALVEPQVAAAQDAIRKVSGAAAEAQSMAPDVAATGTVPERAKPAAPVEVAALQPGAWSMQIASQPSEEGARNAYKDLSERFGGVLGSRGVNIVRAEIEGKGTFWRVRIPAESRNDAVSLCESYKAAGGSCFVSK